MSFVNKFDPPKLTLAMCGIKLSKWLSVNSFPCFSANSFRIFSAHRFSGNSPVAITELRIFIVASTGSTPAILVMIPSISLVTCNRKKYRKLNQILNDSSIDAKF
jgi:hypothetical protein